MTRLRIQRVSISVLAAIIAISVLTGLSWAHRQQAPKQDSDKKEIERTQRWPQEIAVMKALDSHLRANFKGVLLKEFLEALEDKTRGTLTFVIDGAGLRDKQIQPEELVNDVIHIDVKKIKVGTLLRMILGERNAGYYIDDGIVVITAKEKVMVKTYDVSGLLNPKEFERSSTELWSALRQLDPAIRFITKNEPQANVHQPSMTIFSDKNRLIVREALAVHMQISCLLAELRGAPPLDISGIDLDAVRR